MLLVSAVLVIILVAGVAVVRARDGGGPGSSQPQQASSSANAAIQAFFDRYVEGDGRVVRRDQGGDTVSEGQAYALLLAVAQGNQDRFERIWAWTKEHLQRPDGLLSWRWERGRVVDSSPAADADLDAARALVQAGSRFGAPGLHSEGLRIAAGVLDHETVDVGGQLVLVAGPWAVERRIANPSYLSPCTYAELEAASGDRRWGQLRQSGYQMIEALIADGRLPPDWAQVDQQGRVRAIGSPDQPSRAAQFGLDAARVPLRLAEGCDEQGRALAARLWGRLRALAGQGAGIAYSLDGNPLDRNEHPVGLVGAAAAAKAAGADGESKQLLRRARSLDRRTPTYYGSAWVAQGELMLDRPAGKGN